MEREFPVRGILGVVRAASVDEGVCVAEGLARSSIRALMVDYSSPGAGDLVALLAGRRGDAFVGAAGVATPAQVDEAAEAGASFIVSDGVKRDVIEQAQLYDLPIACGARTAIEASAALELGAAAVHVFPISVLGGIEHVNDLRAAAPSAPLIVSGGIQIGEAASYLDAGCIAVGLTSAITDRRAAVVGDRDAVAAYASDALAKIGRA